MNTLGLYFHIPFCASRCGYCDFVSSVADPDSKDGKRAMDGMLAAMLRHVRESSSGAAVDTVFFGGGTPSFFGAKRLSALLDAACKGFKLTRDAEITAECNPDDLGDVKLLKALRKAGFNRLSIGAQSFDDTLLRTVGRRHDAAAITTSVQNARAAGFRNLSLDLIYGFAGQSMEVWRASLRAAVTLAPEHISCYGLTAHEGGGAQQADDETMADMYLEAVDFMSQNGYEQYEISNFAKRGFESRHNLKYWLMQDYLGFGPAAHSDVAGRRFHTLNDPGAYITAIESGDEVITDMELIPPEERAAEYVMLGLRLAHGISGNEYTRRYRAGFGTMEHKLDKLSAIGLAEQNGDRWRLTPKGMLVSNQVIGKLLDV